MAKTLVSDVIVPEIWVPYFREMSTKLNRLFQSGIIFNDPEVRDEVQGGGSIINMPFWQALGGSLQQLSDTGSLTVRKVSGAQDKAIKHLVGDARSWNDLAKHLSGDDPGEAVAQAWAKWWSERMQEDILIPTLTGVFATALSSTHVNDISSEDYVNNGSAANLVSSDAIIDTIGKLGDHWNKVRALAVHSTVFRQMQKDDLITFEPISEQDIEIPRFLGREVIVDDGLPTEAGSTSGTKYTSYLFGNGAFGFGEKSLDENEAFESDRDILASDTVLVTRRHFVVHPRGVAFTGSIAGKSPTVAELKDGSNYTKKYEDKNILITKLVTNG
ncbi:MAG: coat protein [Balneola sp.]|nr:coat protein [Balneola sp.]|tara:strand:+ start:17635 stop:18624 length:990 start_codon:yes stop_codon:yes gene_type:complete